MAGTKGHSGRKGFYQELDIKSLLNKSYSIMMSFLDDENIPNEKKAGFAVAFLSKRVGEKIDIEVSHTISQDQIEVLVSRLKSIDVDSNPQRLIAN